MNQALEDALEYMMILVSQEWDYCDAQFKASQKFKVSAEDLTEAWESIEGKPV